MKRFAKHITLSSVSRRLPSCLPFAFFQKRDASPLDRWIKQDVDYPNFQEVTRLLMGQLLSCGVTERPIQFQPMLLLGDPGIGKTSYLHDLSTRLSLPCKRVDMTSTSAGWVLTGTHPTWSGGQPGAIAKMYLVDHPGVSNPVFILDEVDKSADDRRFPVTSALLPLLEKRTARSFQDEYLEGVFFDLTQSTFFLTANRIDTLSDALLSRMLVVDVPSPTLREKRVIAQRMYQRRIGDLGLAGRYEENLCPEIIDKICDGSLREVDRDLSLAITNAMLRMEDGETVSIGEEDFHDMVKKHGVGFMR
ncbi:MAG: AAA family ATPase [Acidithiobacillus sp.]